MSKFLILFLLMCSTVAFAKDYHVKLHIKNLPATASPLLLRMYNANLVILDSAATREKDYILFNIPGNTPPGMLRSILGMSQSAMNTPQPILIDFLFNQENIELSLDYTNPQNSMEVIQSDENRIYFDFLKTDALFFRKLGILEHVVFDYPDQDDFYRQALDYYQKSQNERARFIDKTYKSNAHTLAGRIIKNQKLPITNGKLTPQERDSIFRNQYLQQVDFNDTLLLYTNVYTDKVFQYIQMSMQKNATMRENEANCIRALDYIVPLMDVNPVIQQHILQFLIAGFESMGMEEALAHISSNYLQQCGSSSDVIKRRLEGYRKMAVGQKVPDFTVNDIQNNPFNLYSELSPYTLILFWHTGCGHCQLLMNELPALSKQGLFSNHQIKIIGISIDNDIAEWEKFSENYHLDWVNIHVNGGFDSPIASDYNLFATPTMFLIDAEHNIIAKPTTSEELQKNIIRMNEKR